MLPSLIYLDDNDDLRQILTELIECQLGISCLSVRAVSELKSFEKQALNCRVAILDIELGLGQPTGIDAFQWLTSRGFQGDVFFLTGHARNHPLIREAQAAGARIWEKPIGSQKILQALFEVFKTPRDFSPTQEMT